MNINRLKYASFAFLAVSLSIFILLFCLEMLFHAYPRLLPLSYRDTFPYKGIELFHPGILEKTPIEGVPIPHIAKYILPSNGHFDVPPSDIEKLGMVEHRTNSDPLIHSNFILKADNKGFPNARNVDTADILLIGDSFMVAAGILSPPGLTINLHEATGMSVYNMGISGIGPLREEWLLNNFGLPLNPKIVIWFFFGGNDLFDDLSFTRERGNGIVNYAQLFTNFRYPKVYLFDLAKKYFHNFNLQKAKKSTLPGFIFKMHDKEIPIWFYPHYLRVLALTQEEIKRNTNWEGTKGVLRRVADDLKRREIKFLFVYIPSKPEAYMPFVKRDDELFHNMASFDLAEPISSSPEEFFNKMMRNRNNMDSLMSSFCNQENITYLSLNRNFEEFALSGGLGFLAADTHWNHEGQNLALIPLIKTITNLKRN